ncbi:endonuclease III [Candidatus Woesebacteria bacterium]|nr:endonuclease III [Candidatus Woesebacteria bacterium]
MTLQERYQKMAQVLEKLFPEARVALNYSTIYELLFAVILSAQCTDKKVNEVTEKLFKKYTTLDMFADATPELLGQDIRSTGFYMNKAKNIIAAAQKLRSDFGGEVPKSMAEMITLPGVARKSANVVLSEAYGINEGVAVDTHMIRLCNKFGLTTQKDPIKIEQDLMKIIPKDQWRLFSMRLVLYGRQYSPAHKVTSDEDPISQALK